MLEKKQLNLSEIAISLLATPTKPRYDGRKAEGTRGRHGWKK